MALANVTHVRGLSFVKLRELERSSEGYGVAFLAVLVCALARYPLQGVLQTRAPYAFYLPMVALCAWRYGLRSAVACFSMGAAVGTYLYVHPTGISRRPEEISLVIFLICSCAIALI